MNLENKNYRATTLSSDESGDFSRGSWQSSIQKSFKIGFNLRRQCEALGVGL